MPKQWNDRKFSDEQNFGLVVGGVLITLGSWWLFRGRFGLLALGFLMLGGVLIFLGLIFPRALMIPYRGWMAFAEGLSVVMTGVILAIVFFGTIMPIGIWKRFRGWDPLQRRARSVPSYWKSYPDRQRNARHYEKMF